MPPLGRIGNGFREARNAKNTQIQNQGIADTVSLGKRIDFAPEPRLNLCGPEGFQKSRSIQSMPTRSIASDEGRSRAVCSLVANRR